MKNNKKYILLTVGYVAQNGYVFTTYDCERYNRIQMEISRFIDVDMPLPVGLLDHGCMTFKQITGMI